MGHGAHLLPGRRAGLNLAEVDFQPVEPLVPEHAGALDPGFDTHQRFWLDARRPELRLPAAGDEPGPLKDLQMLRNRRQGHFERVGQLIHRCFPLRQPGQDCSSGRIGQGVKGLAQRVQYIKSVSYITK